MASGAGRRYRNRRQFQISDGFVDSVPICGASEVHKQPDRVARGKWPTFSQGLRPRAQQAGAPTTERLLAPLENHENRLKFRTA